MEFPVNFEMWTLIIGILLPLVISIMVKPDWPPLRKYWVAFLLCLGAAFGDVWYSGAFSLVDIGETILKMIFLCFTSYLAFWRPSGIAETVEKRVLGGKRIAVFLFMLILPLGIVLMGCQTIDVYHRVSADNPLDRIQTKKIIVLTPGKIRPQTLQGRSDVMTPALPQAPTIAPDTQPEPPQSEPSNGCDHGKDGKHGRGKHGRGHGPPKGCGR